MGETPVASLMMYRRPEMDGVISRFWAELRLLLAGQGVPAPRELTQTGDPFAVWENPWLVLSQTCGMPFRTRLHPSVNLVGTPDYGLDGCSPGYYRSALVVRADDPRETLAEFRAARFVCNERGSQSGFGAPWAHTRALGWWFATYAETGSHRASALAVARNEADIAALDAQTWRLIQRYDGFAQDLRVLDWTTPTPGLPLITAAHQDPKAIARAVRAALQTLSPEDRDTLGMSGLIDIAPSAYLAVPTPPPEV